MNQEARKIIKSNFCPKQKWIADRDAKNCFKCDYQFNSLFRRKHHCRYCGNIFCQKCSSNFFDGEDIAGKQQKIRMCDGCYQVCCKYLKKHDEQKKNTDKLKEDLPEIIEPLKYKKASSFTRQQKINQIKLIINQYSHDQLKCLKKLQADADKTFVILLQMLLKERKIALKYFPNILEVVKEVVDRIPLNGLISNAMDICKNVKFKCFKSDKFSIKLMNKVLVKKYYQGKKIKDSYQNKNCILMYGGLQSSDLVGNAANVKFEQIVKRRINEMIRIIQICKRLKVEMIFLQKNIEKQCDDKFLEAGIILVPKIKIDHLTKLKIALQIQEIVSSVFLLDKYQQEKIVGRITQFTVQEYASIKQQGKIKRFYQIKPLKDELGMTVMILGNKKQQLLRIKNQFKWIIMILRHIKLQIHQVMLDISLMNSMKQQVRNQCYLNHRQMFFSRFDGHHFDVFDWINQKHLSYKKITYSKNQKLQNFPQVTMENLEEYYKNRKQSFCNKWDCFTKICGQIKSEHRLFYSDDDCPIGVYLLKKITLMDKKCKHCKRPNDDHFDVFYSTDHYVKVWTQSTVRSQTQNQEFQLIIDKQSDDIQHLYFQLQKQKQVSKMQCFIQCKKSEKQLSSRIVLSGGHLQYSLTAFLNHCFKGVISTSIRQNNDRSKQNSSNNNEYNRVFVKGKKLVKIYIGSYTLNRKYTQTKKARELYLTNLQIEGFHNECIKKSINIQKIGQYLLDEIKKIGESSKLLQMDNMFQNPKSSFVNVKSSLVHCNDRRSLDKCLQMILPGLIEQISNIMSIAQALLKDKKQTACYFECHELYHIIIMILKKRDSILKLLKKSIKRRGELQKQYQNSQFQQNYSMDQCQTRTVLDCSVYQSQYDITQNDTGKQYSTVNTCFQTNDTYHINQNIYHRDKVDIRNQRKRSEMCNQLQIRYIFKQILSELTVENGYLKYVPAYPNMPNTLIACALNSKIHKQCINNGNQIRQLTVNMSKYLQQDLIIDCQELKKYNTSIKIYQKMLDIGINKIKKYQNNHYQICLIQPNLFQLFRKNQICLELFIQSVGGAQAWAATGGKSSSSFMKSFNNLLAIKRVSQRQFNTLIKMLQQYFAHMSEGSLLVPIYGAYIIRRNTESQYYIIMQHLYFGMKNSYLYDFKGSQTKRFSKYPVIPLDINFLIDRNSEPIWSKDNVLLNLDKTLDFLCNHNIVDYSLILAIQIAKENQYYMDGNRFYFAIVDYLREFGTMEKVQRTWKGQCATVQKPADYKIRMEENLRKYFTQIPI